MQDVSVRPAVEADAASIAAVYNHYIEHSNATFDTEVKTAEERVAWLAQHTSTHPVLVAEDGATVIGWGALSPWGVRPGWRHTAEIAIYLAPERVGRGVGTVLLDRLITEARQAGHHALLGQIVAENHASLALLERAGFERVGYLKEVGRKFDRWIDLVMMQLTL